MNFLNIFLIAVALSFDAMAVGAANGAHHHRMPLKKALEISFYFGFFQLFMPLIGWLIGSSFQAYVTEYDHWIAFILLGILGLKMLKEAFAEDDEAKTDIHSWKILVLLSIATSIDALVVGMSLAFFAMNIALVVIIIGITTFILTLASIYLGKKFGERWGKKAEIAGGLILISIGLKILLSHLLA